MIRSLSIAAAAGAAVAFSGASAHAQLAGELQPYVSISGGVGLLQDSDNSGAFSSEFETGAGAGLTLPAGTDVGWTTEFDTGFAIAGAVGARRDNLRGELELAFQGNDVDTHVEVGAGGLALDGLDAGVLITGSDPLGITIGDLVADGQGSVDALYLMGNVYLDIPLQGAPVTPYIGAGIGAGFVDVEYTPSATPIVEDDATVFAYQVMAGASAPVGERVEIFGGYRYRGTSDVEVEVGLFPATLDVENQSHILEAGIRFRF